MILVTVSSSCVLSGDGGAVGDHRRQQAGVELCQVHSEGVLEVKTSNVGGRWDA